MKREIKHILQAVFASMLLLVSSCSDFLDEKDPSNVTQDNYYTIPDHAEAAIRAVYAQSRFMAGGAEIFSANYQMIEMPTGAATTQTTQNAHLNNLVALEYDGTTAHVQNWWNGLYNLIAQTHLVLEKVPGINPMDEAQKKRILGEAHFFRAWAYFYLVRLYGDVPLITSTQTASSPDFFPTRTPIENVYQVIVDDLVAAEASGLPWTDVTGRVSLAAVKSQLSKVYLTMAGQPLNKGGSHYTLAANKAKEVIDYANANAAAINLFPAYNDLHKVANNNRVEHIFQIQFNSIVQGNPMQGFLLPLAANISAQSGQGSLVPTLSFYESYEDGDGRTVNRQGFFYTSYWTRGSQEPLIELGAPYIFKHFDVASNGTLGSPGNTTANNLNVPNIRYAEVLLIFAEAQNEVSSPTQEAYDALKRIRDRAQLVTPALGDFTQASFREAVWRERWYELCYEGVTWFDMVRLRKAFNEDTKSFDDFVGHININSNRPLQQKHLLFPLPSNEIRNNPNLKGQQNPGYPE